MDFPRLSDQWVSDETHYTLRCAILCATVLFFCVFAINACNEEAAARAIVHSNSPLTETCVTHPISKKVVVSE